jgi:hypothetical protein
MYICCETFTVNAIAPVYCRAAGAQRVPKKVIFDAKGLSLQMIDCDWRKAIVLVGLKCLR